MSFEIINQATLQQVVQLACQMVGYPVSPSPSTSSDPKIQQMIAAANQASRELFTQYEWSELTQEFTLTVVQDVPDQKEKGFDLPQDFFRFIDQTQWNGAMRLPAHGPVTPQGWMAYLVMPITSIFTLTWQMREGKIWFLNPPEAPGMPFRFMYYSNALVIDADTPSLLKNFAVKNGDIFRLDGNLITLLARAKWLGWNGFDTANAQREYNTAYDTRVGAMKGAPILSAVRFGGLHLINAANVPSTGFGR